MIMYDEKNNNQEFSSNGNPDEHKAEEITTNFVMKDSAQEESSTQENQGQQMTGGESHAGQSQTVTGEVSQTASYGQSGYGQSQSQSGQTLGGQTQSSQSMYGQNSQNGQQNQNAQGQGLNQYHPGQQGYSQYGQNRYSQSQYGENRTSGSYQNSYIPPEPAKKEKKKHGMASKIAGITAAALLFGTVSGGTMVGINMISDSFRKAEYPQVSQSETLADNGGVNQAEDSTEASGNAQASVALATDVSSIVEKAMPSVVAINNTMLYQGSTWFGQTQTYEVPSSGSGIIAGQNDTELLIITNNHVVEDSEELSVTFIDNQSVKAAVKGTDSDSDLAVIAVQLSDIPEETRKQIKAADLGDSDSLKLGQGVVAIGNALGQGQSVTVGYVSALNKKLTINDVERTLLQVDAAINPGNSGGALLNMNGEVIGINAAKYSDTSVEGIGYAIPISQAKDIISDLMTKVAVDENEQGYLGIQLQNIDSQMAQAYGMPEGIYVYKIVAGGAASRSDLRERDIITKFDGEKVKNGDDLKKLLTYYKAGSTVTMTVQSLENGKYVERNVQITLGSKSDMPQSQDSQNESRSESQASPQRKLGR